MPRRRRRQGLPSTALEGPSNIPGAGADAAGDDVVAVQEEDFVTRFMRLWSLDENEMRYVDGEELNFAQFWLRFVGDTEGEDAGDPSYADHVKDLWDRFHAVDPSCLRIRLLSGAVVSDRAFFPGARVSDVRDRLDRIRLAGQSFRLRHSLCVGSRQLLDSESLPSCGAEGICAVVVAESTTTSVMVRNIPAEWTPNQICRWIDAQGLSNTYDLVYVPIDLEKDVDYLYVANLGYCFINFATERDARRSYKLLDVRVTGGRAKYTEVSNASWQGVAAYKARCHEKIGSGEAHRMLSVRLGVCPFSSEGSRISLEDWLGVSSLPSLDDLAAAVALGSAGQVCRRSDWGLRHWRERVFARFAQ